MILVKPSFEILEMSDIKLIERAGRTCYKSENKITDESATSFVKMLDEREHHAMLEHSFASVKIICDRGVSHELVRHRLFSFAQESTRYCNYSKDKFENQCTFVIPSWINYIEEGEFTKALVPFFLMAADNEADKIWYQRCINAEKDYFRLLKQGWTPEKARSVLPNSLKTEIVVSGNFRQWKHFFKLRTDKTAHPQMREIAIPLQEEFEKRCSMIRW